MPHNLFEGNTYKYILTDIDAASRYKFARSLRTKKSSEIAFALEAIYEKDGVFKYPKTFQCDNGSEFKKVVTKLLEKQNVDIRGATAKYKHTHTDFVEAFKKCLQNCCLNQSILKSFNTLEKYRQFGSKI